MDRNLKIGIIGLGLIGGSIFKALCALKCDVYAASKSTTTIQKAKKYSPKVSKSLLKLKKCDIIFVCTPMNKTIEILEKLNKLLSKKTIVADVCSLKGFLSKRKYNYTYIPTHPMAGTEFAGFEYSFEALFQGSKWVLTPPKNIDKTALKKVIDVIEVLGSKPVFTTPKAHDKAVAIISHMPMIVSQALFKVAKDNKLAMKLAAGGFRDTTRLALSHEEMANDMVELNSVNIQNSLLQLYASIGELLSGNYSAQAREIRKNRQFMYVNGNNIL